MFDEVESMGKNEVGKCQSQRSSESFRSSLSITHKVRYPSAYVGCAVVVVRCGHRMKYRMLVSISAQGTILYLHRRCLTQEEEMGKGWLKIDAQTESGIVGAASTTLA